MAIDPKRVKEIFLEAAELPDEAARAAYLDRACGDDAGLRVRVEALLQSLDPDGGFLGTPATVVPDPDHAGTVAYADPERKADPTSAAEALSFLAPAGRPGSLGRIGHYEVLQVLGHGAFGVVFRASDEVLNRVVAVKVMAPQIAATSPARKRFLREARALAAVRHENVVQVYEVGEQPLPYLVMEFIPGETLQQSLDRLGPLDVRETLRIGRQIAEGLAAAHDHDLIHRDIKPGNVLLESGPHGHAKITDFGLARAADDASISQSGIVAGTPMYMAPEQAQGQTLDQRADLFSLGSVLYQMVAGRPPFRANTTVAVLKRVAEDQPRAIREIIPETPQWLCDIITKLHAKNPDDRYQSAREVADVLADCEAQLKANSMLKDFSRIPRGKSASSGKWKWVVAAAVLLLPLIALAATESAGVTHLFRGQQATTDTGKPGGNPTPELAKPGGDLTPAVVPRTEAPTPVVKQEPVHADLAASHHALALIQFGQGKMDEAQKHFDQAVHLREALVKDEPKNAHYQADLAASRGYQHLVRARQLAEQKRNKEAEAALAKSEESPFNDAQAYRERGRTYFALGQVEKAAADFRKAVELLDDRALEALARPSEQAAFEVDKLLARLADDALLAKLSAALERNPDDMTRRWSRGERYARRARWKEAAADFTAGLEAKMALSSDSAGKTVSWLYVAPVLAIADREGYYRLCREMLKRFGETQDPDTAARIAKSCLLLPEFFPEIEKACQLADRAVSLGKHHASLVWFLHCKGLADYRRGDYRATIEGLEPILPGDGVGFPPLTTEIELALAMARYQKGEEKAAREHLARAAKLLDQNLTDPVRSPLQKDSRYDPEWAIAWLLYREAQTLIEGAKDESKK
jgi:serine/threonine protein kinase